MNRKPGAAVAGMTLVLLTAVLVSLSMGSVRVPVLSVLGQALGLCAQRTGEYATQAYILAQVRLPRIVLCMLTGISLGVGGCVMQTLFRNPLASPFTMGVSSGASFGAALAMVLGVGILQQNFLFTGYSLVAMNAFVFGMISLLLVSAVAKMSRSDMSILILVGTAVNSLFSAGVSVLKYISGAEALKNLESWLMGGFWGANWKAVLVLVPLLAVSVGVLLRMAWDFNAMNAGEETAATMGVPVKWLKRISLGLVTLIASITIAFSGVIGFIGLIAPHAARSMAGTDNRYLLPASGMMGAIVLLVSDTVSRTILSPKEIPVGIITSLLGVPFFIYILSRRRKQMWGGADGAHKRRAGCSGEHLLFVRLKGCTVRCWCGIFCRQGDKPDWPEWRWKNNVAEMSCRPSSAQHRNSMGKGAGHAANKAARAGKDAGVCTAEWKRFVPHDCV